MWGSHRDARLLKRLENSPAFEKWKSDAGLLLAEGPQLRKGPGKGLTLIKELIGKKVVTFRGMRGEVVASMFPKIVYQIHCRKRIATCVNVQDVKALKFASLHIFP